MTHHVLDRLDRTIAARRHGDPSASYVAKLTARGRAHIARKVGEEGVELALASVTGTPEEVTAEAADLLFHMMILLADCDVPLDQVFAELERREGLSGLEEKAARPPE